MSVFNYQFSRKFLKRGASLNWLINWILTGKAAHKKDIFSKDIFHKKKLFPQKTASSTTGDHSRLTLHDSRVRPLFFKNNTPVRNGCYGVCSPAGPVVSGMSTSAQGSGFGAAGRKPAVLILCGQNKLWRANLKCGISCTIWRMGWRTVGYGKRIFVINSSVLAREYRGKERETAQIRGFLKKLLHDIYKYSILEPWYSIRGPSSVPLIPLNNLRPISLDNNCYSTILFKKTEGNPGLLYEPFRSACQSSFVWPLAAIWIFQCHECYSPRRVCEPELKSNQTL